MNKFTLMGALQGAPKLYVYVGISFLVNSTPKERHEVVHALNARLRAEILVFSNQRFYRTDLEI